MFLGLFENIILRVEDSSNGSYWFKGHRTPLSSSRVRRYKVLVDLILLHRPATHLLHYLTSNNPTSASETIQNMNVHPFRSILKPNRSYVCLSCLLKQSAPRKRQSLRYQSSTTESTPSSTTDSGFAVEGGALGSRRTKVLKENILSKANSPNQSPEKQQPGEASSKQSGNSEQSAGIKDSKVQAAKQKAKPKTKPKPKKVSKHIDKPALALDATASAADPVQHDVDSGAASPTGRLGTASTPDLTAAKKRQRRRRKVAERKTKGNAGQTTVRAKPPDTTSRVVASSIRKVEDKERVQSSKGSEAILAQATQGLIQKNEQDQPSSTPNQRPLTPKIKSGVPAAVTKSVVRHTLSRIRNRTIRKVAVLLAHGNVPGTGRKVREEKKLRLEKARSNLKISLESAVKAHKGMLKAKDKAGKIIEAKAKRPRKVRVSLTR